MATKITIAFFLLSFTVQIFGKNVVPFWSEDFGLGQFPIGWTSYDAFGQPVTWQHCSIYNQSPLVELTEMGLFPDEQFRSASMENGFAYLYPFKIGAAQDNHSSSLETAVIDCSGKSEVFLTFNTFIMAKYSDPMASAVLEVRNGNSPFWTKFNIFPTLSQSLVDKQPLFPGEPRFQSINGQFACIDISSVAAKMDEVYIRWTWDWEGPEEYCWLIDDIELLDENPIDENAIWGKQLGEGDFLGSLNGWSATSNVNCKWNWSSNGLVDYPDASDEANGFGCSCSVLNGAAVMNATTCYPTLSFSKLISPKIDLSDADPGKRLGLRFHQSGSLGNNNPNSYLPLTFILVSADGGQTYIDTIFLNLTEAFNKPFCKTTLVELPNALIGATEAVVEFVFSGDTFYWIIDDVRVVEMFDNDLRISEDYFAVAQNYSTPAGLEQPIAFAAEVQNIGNLEQDFTRLYVDIFEDETQTIVFQDTLMIGNLLPGETSAAVMFKEKFTPAPNQSYTGFYSVTSDSEEEHAADNKVSFRFNTKGTKYSKNIDKYSISGGFTVNSFNPRYEIGNCFYIPPGIHAKANSIQFVVNNGQENADAEMKVDVNLYQWKNGDISGDENGNLKADPNEFVKIASTHYTFQVAYSIIDEIDVPFQVPIDLDEDTYYFATIDYNLVATVNNNQLRLFIAASEQLNYASMFEQSEICGQPYYTSMLRKSGESSFTANAWGLLRTPYINLNIDALTPAEEETGLERALKIYPNPNSGQFQLEMPIWADGRGITYEIFDICGHLALPRQNVEGYVSHLPIDVSQLSNGLYNLRVVSGNRVGVHKFVVEKTH